MSQEDESLQTYESIAAAFDQERDGGVRQQVVSHGKRQGYQQFIGFWQVQLPCP